MIDLLYLVKYFIDTYPFLFFFYSFFSCLILALFSFLLLLLCAKIFKSLK